MGSAAESPPYAESDLDAAAQALDELEDVTVTPASLSGVTAANSRPIHAVLRRRDLVELFDTLPDLSGNDIDVARFIRDDEDLDVQVASQRLWRRAVGGC